MSETNSTGGRAASGLARGAGSKPAELGVPIEALFENLRGGMSLEEFFENYPTVDRSQVDTVLELVSRDLESRMSRAA
jgi:hypothetical protein